MTGIYIQVRDKVNADLPEPAHGNHLWNWVAVFRCADPEAGEMIADSENLLSIVGPGCLHCEEPYSPALARKRCKPV